MAVCCDRLSMSDPSANLKDEIKQAIVQSLRLPIEPESIEDGVSLFGEGLGLDSIDVLEIALAVSRKYGFQLRSDDPANRRIFASLRSLSAHIAQHRTR